MGYCIIIHYQILTLHYSKIWCLITGLVVIFFQWGNPPLCVTFSIRLLVRPCMCSSLRRAPYLRNGTSSNYKFWHACIKWWHLQLFFSFFWNFNFLGCCGGKSAKYSPKWKTTIILWHTISEEQYSILAWFLVQMCKIMIYKYIFFRFL